MLHKIGNKSGSEAGKTKCRDRIYFAEEQYNNQDGRDHGLSLIHILFLGQDFGQLREWSEEREIDWFLLADEGHQHLQTFFSDLLKMYRKYPALYANDCGYEGFQWINANDGDRSIYSFVRWSPTGKNNLLFVCNCTPVERPDYMCGVPRKKQYRLILDSSDMKYGGPTEKRQMVYRAKNGECDGQPYRIAYSLPALSLIHI